MFAGTSHRLDGLLETHFRGVPSFNQNLGGYAAVPWIFRSLLALMSARQWTILSYLYLRSGPQGLSWETDRTIALDLNIGAKKLSPHLRKLEELGFIATRRLGRNRYVKLVDPMSVAERFASEESSLNAD